MNAIAKKLATQFLLPFYFLLLTSGIVCAQTIPQRFSYQSIIRNPGGQALQNQSLGMRLSILQGSESGTAVFVETHSATTNSSGLVTLQVGGGTVVSGSMASINWANGPYFIKTETDPEGGTNYSITGSSQLLSVPYALNAANGVANGTATNQMMYWNGSSWVALDPGNNGQVLTICNGLLTWTTGGICPASLPILTTTAASSVTATTASSGGNITNDGGGSITARGVVWSTSQNPTIALTTKTSDGTGSGSFSSSLTGLTPGTTYYIRAYATNSAGTAYGTQVSFTTAPLSLPTLTTTSASIITTLSAVSGGNISNDGFASVTARGVCWSASQNPTIALSTKTSDGSGTGSFSSNLSGLLPGTTYQIRAYATNSVGTAYGNQVSFTTVSASISDVDGNAYPTLTIGNQVWLKENLKVSKYRNGNAITTNLSNTEWIASTSGAYGIYNNSSTNNTTYGKLYNWYAVTDPRGLCPAGWHVPTDHDWNILAINVDAAADTNYCLSWNCTNPADAKMKSTGTIQAGNGLWSIANSDATNASGFTGLPGGSRDFDGTYLGQGEFGAWWSSEAYSNTAPRWGYSLPYDQCRNSLRLDFVGPFATNSYGFSVRCLKD